MPRRHLRCLFVLLTPIAGLCLQTVAHASDSQQGDASGQARLASYDDEPGYIIGGRLAESCEWPSTVAITAGVPGDPSKIQVCTGTLIHPEIIVTAAHCEEGTIEKIGFGEYRKSAARNVGIEKCVRHPDYTNSNKAGIDFAYCKLSSPVTDVPIVPVMMGCEIDALQPGAPVVGVGFGVTSASAPSSDPKMVVETSFQQFSGSGERQEAIVGVNGSGFCFGDSGGPVFVELPEDQFGKGAGWRVFGATSRGDSGCSGPANFGVLWNWVGFVEEDSGIDVTPCHDADGTWNPSSECTGAPLDAGSGSWSNGCAGGEIGGEILSCGDSTNTDETSDSEETSTTSDESTSTATDESSTSESTSQIDSEQTDTSQGSTDSEDEASSAGDQSTSNSTTSDSQSGETSGDSQASSDSQSGSNSDAGGDSTSPPSGGCRTTGQTPLVFGLLSLAVFGVSRRRRTR